MNTMLLDNYLEDIVMLKNC